MANKQLFHHQDVTPARAKVLRGQLLAWYDRHRRVMPWRAPAGNRSDPYHIWLSEIMLQQTTVATVGPYFLRFLERWPSVHALAHAELDDVLHGWQGLGYYARARNLYRCAQVVSQQLDGVFPDTEDALRQLPGIGPYTAAAITAIAFDRPASVVDGNVERVMARLFAIEDALPMAKTILRDCASALAPKSGKSSTPQRSGDYAQALMDLGATVCTPRKPACGRCPWSASCAAKGAAIAEELPRRAPRKEKPTRRGVAFWAVAPDGAILLRRRPEMGLLGGMMEVPSTEWREAGWTKAAARMAAPVTADWKDLPGQVLHTFTHFHLELEVMAAHVKANDVDGVWSMPDKFGDHALPTVMKKIVTHVMKVG